MKARPTNHQKTSGDYHIPLKIAPTCTTHYLKTRPISNALIKNAIFSPPHAQERPHHKIDITENESDPIE
jgi:hypothetical protein